MTQDENRPAGFGRAIINGGKKALRLGRRSLPLIPWLPYIVIGLLVIVAAGLFQAYFALTRETAVAEVIMSPMQTDEAGKPYIDIQFIPYKLQSAWDTALRGEADNQKTPAEPQTFRVYGDTVAVRGPLIALQNGWRIFNFDNIYKLALIEGEYRMPGNSGKGEGSEFAINGGFEESWWDVNNQEAKFPYNTVIKRVTFSGDEEPGFTGNFKKRYQIVVTADSITWNFMGTVSS